MENFNQINWLIKIFKEVFEETKNKIQPVKFQTWIYFYSNWIDLFKWFNQYLGNEWANSLLFSRAFELNKHLLWLSFSVSVGAYHCVIRELRYILESNLQAYYIDREYSTLSIKQKLEKLRDMGRKRRVVKDVYIKGLPYGTEIHKVYADLCKYVHPSFMELEPVIKYGKVEPKILFTFDEELFDKCADFTSKIMDIFIVILLNSNSIIENKIKSDKLMIDLIKSLPSQFSLKYLKRNNKRNKGMEGTLPD